MKKTFLLVLLSFLGTVLFLNNFVSAKKPNDWLKNAFGDSHTIVSEPYASNIEADDLFQDAIAIWGGTWEWNNVMVRFWRFMMRISLILWVTMLIFIWIKVALAFGDSDKMQDALKLWWQVLLWAFLVLASVAIVYLVASLMRWSLNYQLFNS